MHKKISLLPNLLISQIAAGEVIERPASIIKELIENSLDGGATRIDIELQQGGIDSIIIKDNGSGISQYDLPLALMRHATSKIHTLLDLENINTLGFRGEALAAISAVSHVTLKSRIENAEYGFSVTAHDIENYLLESKINNLINNPEILQKSLTPCNMNTGTYIQVSDIFFRTPARRKFLKSMQTEWGHSLDIVRKLALLNPNVHFELIHNNKLAHVFPVCSIEERVAQFVGSEFMNNALVVETTMGEYKVLAFLASPLIASERSQIQYSIVNNRFVKDRVIMHALKACYKDILHGQKQAQYLIYLNVPVNEIDVNVHPSKSEVRFKHSNAIHHFLYKALEPELSKNIMHTQNSNSNNVISIENLADDNISLKRQFNKNETTNFDNKNNFLNHKSNGDNTRQREKYAEQLDILLNTQGNSTDINSSPWYLMHEPKTPFLPASPSQFTEETNTSGESQVNNSTINEADYPLGFAVAQLHGVYILAQNMQGLVLVDTHAAHERIVYEQLKKQLQDKIDIQNLLVPHCIRLDEAHMQKIISYLPALEQLGFMTKIHNQNELHIYSLPQLLDKTKIKDIIDNILHDLIELPPINLAEEQQQKILSSMACHKAVRANDKLSIPEMNALLRLIEQTEKGNYCNHGRPTWIQIKLESIDKFFMRGE